MKPEDIEVLKDMAKRVKNNVPNHRDPALFFEEKSEIVNCLRNVIQRASPQKHIITRERNS